MSNVNLSAFHTAWCVTHCPSHALNVSAPLQAAAAELESFVTAVQTPPARFWEQLFSLSASVDFSGTLAERVCSRVGLSATTYKSRLAGILNECRRQFEQAYPQYTHEMTLRTGPVRDLWDGHGAGLLRWIGLVTAEPLAVESAQVVLVQPILGGMGYAHLSTNRIHLEAVLTHVDPRLPETLRTAWLLSQLDLDRPVYSEGINSHRLRGVAGLAMLPVVLDAGRELELCHFSAELITRAIELWHADTLQVPVDTTSAIVATWWETYQAARPPWKIALHALDQMLQ